MRMYGLRYRWTDKGMMLLVVDEGMKECGDPLPLFRILLIDAAISFCRPG
jgi:hypothetical protein